MKLKITSITNSHAYAWCPFHNDNHPGGKPSLEIKLEGEHYGEYYCFGCGKAGKLTNPVMSKIVAHKKIKKVDKRVSEINWSALSGDYEFNFFDRLIKDPQNKPFNVGTASLHDLSCGWDGEAWTFPTRNDKNEIIGIQRRFKDGFKSMVEGSRLGLFIPQILFDPALPVIICEGASDTASVLDIGYQALGRPNNQYGNEIVFDFLGPIYELNVDLWYIMADNDEAGIKGATQLAKELMIEENHILIPMEKDIRKHIEKIGQKGTQIWIDERLSL